MSLIRSHQGKDGGEGGVKKRDLAVPSGEDMPRRKAQGSKQIKRSGKGESRGPSAVRIREEHGISSEEIPRDDAIREGGEEKAHHRGVVGNHAADGSN